MIFKILRNPKFWIWWIILSGIGGIASFIYINNQEKNLLNAKIVYVKEFRQGGVNKNIIAIKNIRDSLAYVNYIKNNSNLLDFDFDVLSQNKKVYILEKIEKNNQLIKIGIKWPNNDRIHQPFEEYWIWYQFLNDTVITTTK